MSAYVVENKCIENILHAASIVHGEVEEKVSLEHRGKGYGFLELGQKLLEMNENAVNQRYRESSSGDKFKFSTNMVSLMAIANKNTDATRPAHVNNIQAYKSINCFLYQCSEGDVPESELFKEVEHLQAALADKMIKQLPEYDKSAWGG